MSTTTDEHTLQAQGIWVWKTSKDHLIDIYPIATGVEGWYPESREEREPVTYRLDNLTTGESITRTVYPLAPWNAADAISDVCWKWGWEDTTYVDPGKCEHGLSADLCAGPGHYPADDHF